MAYNLDELLAKLQEGTPVVEKTADTIEQEQTEAQAQTNIF